MRTDPVPADRRQQLSDFVADRMGLHFPPERWADLQRGLAGAAAEYGFEDVADCTDWLLSTPPTRARLQTLAEHLTIGETYFFREKQTFEVLARTVLPGLISARRGREQRLRLWSAGCCTGEEAYSLAILLRQLLPDLPDWQVTLLATDINPHFLRKAGDGSYGEWSFRATPADFKERHFHRGEEGRHVIAPAIRAMVTFEHLNLVEDGYPSLATDTHAMDLIFCRNVLMYFRPAQIRKVIGKMHRALRAGGWLVVSPSETQQELFPAFATRNFPGVILYQKPEPDADRVGWQTAAKSNGGARPTPPPEPPPSPREAPTTPDGGPGATGEQDPTTTDDTLRNSVGGLPATLAACSLRARTFANEGKLAEALIWCDRWIAADKIDAAGHYLRGAILLEHGSPEESRRALQRAAYLQPELVLVHFTLGNLARRSRWNDEADKHFAHALHLLARLPPAALLPESDGLTAGRLFATITALTAPEAAR